MSIVVYILRIDHQTFRSVPKMEESGILGSFYPPQNSRLFYRSVVAVVNHRKALAGAEHLFRNLA